MSRALNWLYSFEGSVICRSWSESPVESKTNDIVSQPVGNRCSTRKGRAGRKMTRGSKDRDCLTRRSEIDVKVFYLPRPQVTQITFYASARRPPDLGLRACETHRTGKTFGATNATRASPARRPSE